MLQVRGDCFVTVDQENSNQKNSRPTVGLLIDYARPVSAGGYQSILWAGIADALQEQDANLICFAGRALNEPYQFETQRNVVYNLVDREVVDVLIFCGGLGNFVTVEEYQQFCAGFSPIPIVSIALPVAGMPTVLINNETGLRDGLVHLIETHGYRRIAFIRGVAGNQEAELRYQVYTDVLAEYDLLLDPNLVAPGDFLPPTGAQAIQIFLDQRHLRPGFDIEAIVAANDGMALGALEALQLRGIEVPDEIALLGFDDIREAGLVTPPLTTVRQPLYQQGRHAVEMALALLDGKSVAEPETLSTELILRQSCGCLPQTIRGITIDAIDETIQKETVQTQMANRRAAILTEMTLALEKRADKLPLDWAAQLLDAFIANLADPSTEQFIFKLRTFLRRTQWRFRTADAWQQVITVLHRQTQTVLTPDTEALLRADKLWQQARILIGEMAWHAQASKELVAEQQNDVLGQINEIITTTFDIPTLMDVLAHELPRLDIGSCYLALYDPSITIPSPGSRLMLAYNRNGRLPLSGDGQQFKSCKLVPENILLGERRYSILVQPLFFQDEHLGFVLFEIGRQPHNVYEILRRQISSALKGALLLQEREQAREELARSNQALEQFAYVASHDLQEPLRMVISYLQLLERRYRNALDDDAQDFIDYAVDGATRMKILINDLLAYSRVTTHSKPFAPTNCTALVKSVLVDLQVMIEESGGRVTYDPLPTVIADDTQLRQVFQNLIGNGLKFRGDDPPHIHVGAKQQNNPFSGSNDDTIWLFWVRDNGVGIAPEHFERIFMVFQRLSGQQAIDGTGIGLAVCQKTVEHHGGRIWVESEPGKGSTFYFTIPDRAVDAPMLEDGDRD
jgi:signal transduction histidine kinase/DNA-binding LacI/PurR family transcriptional regulator